MATFMLLLKDGPANLDLSPEEMQKVVQKYQSWRDRLAEAGRLVGGQKLIDAEGRILSRKNGSVRVLDGPFSETKEMIAGYFAIQAADFDEAVTISEDCPHLEYGTIELRQVDEAH